MARLTNNDLQGLGALPAPAPTTTTTATKPAATDWAGTAQTLMTAAVQARYMDKVLKENLRREKAGLAPLDMEKFQPGVKVGLDPQTRGMIWAGGLLAALLAAFALWSAMRPARG